MTARGLWLQTYGMWDGPDMAFNEEIMGLYEYDDESDDSFDEHSTVLDPSSGDPEHQVLDPFAAYMSKRFAKMAESRSRGPILVRT